MNKQEWAETIAYNKGQLAERRRCAEVVRKYKIGIFQEQGHIFEQIAQEIERGET